MINWIHPTRGGVSHHGSPSLFRLSNQKGGGENRTQAVIFIHEKAMKELRWVVGDKVIFAIEGNDVYLKRVTSKGFSLSAATGGKASDFVGKMASASIKSSKHVFGFQGTVYINGYTMEGDVVKLTYKVEK